MIKIVYNNCYGGFGLSKPAAERLLQLGVEEMTEEIKLTEESAFYSIGQSYSIPKGIERHDPRLIQVIEEFGAKASGSFSSLIIGNIEGNQYYIDDYDGHETIITPSDIKWIIAK